MGGFTGDSFKRWNKYVFLRSTKRMLDGQYADEYCYVSTLLSSWRTSYINKLDFSL